MSFLKSNKVLNHPKRYQEWYNNGDTIGPVTVKIDLTNVCNHDCPGCIDYELIHNDNNSLNFNLFEDLLGEMWVEKELQEYGTPDVYLLKKPEHGEYHWLVEYRTKMLSPVRHSSEVIPILSLGDDKFVCWVGKSQYIVSASLMSYVGEN